MNAGQIELILQAGQALEAAKKLLDRIDNITTAEFERGGERAEREALRAALIAFDAAGPQALPDGGAPQATTEVQP